MGRTPPRLDGLRILVVEDEFLLALALEDDLHAEGAAVLGPFNRLDTGLAAGRTDAFDVAVLDVNLDGTMVYPLADALIARGIPFVFLSGYTAANLPPRFAGVHRLGKPCERDRLVAGIRFVLTQA